jgi:phospholipid/cholesterol/gamma-HCH transport system ATP-binding protein
MTQSNAIVSLSKVCFARGNRLLLQDISLDVTRGSVTSIMGPSGSGKTTLLRLIGGALMPESGSVRVAGQEVPHLSRSELYKLRRDMGFLFQSGALFTNHTVFDNVAFPIREHTNHPESLVRDLVLLKLQAVGLRGAAQMMPSELSGGMSRRVAMARAIALEPNVVLYDEPFAGQDPITTGVLLKLIRQLNDALGLTSIIVSHDVAQTAKISDQLYVISQGKVIASGAPQALLSSHQEDLRQFLHGLPDGSIPFHFPALEMREELLS